MLWGEMSEKAITSLAAGCLLNKVYFIKGKKVKDMRKKCLMALVLAGVLSVGQMAAYAAPSPDPGIEIVRPSGGGGGGGGGGGRGGVTSNGTVTVGGGPGVTSTIVDTTTPLASMAQLNAMNGSGVIGNVLTLVTGVNTSAGVPINANDQNQAVVGDMAFSFATGAAETAGLPADVVASINGINAGQPLSAALNMPALEGYSALSNTRALIARDAVTGQEKVATTEISLYVPNLVQGLNNVSVLFYDNTTNHWVVLPVSAIDWEKKMVSVNVIGSGTLSVIYKQQ